MKKISTALLVAILFLTSSCVTKSLWGHKSYIEKIKQFFVGSDGRYIVFVSKDNHYVFTDNSRLLQQVLSLKQRGVLKLNSQKTYLKLDSNNDVNGYLVLEGHFDLLPSQDAIKLHSMGFSPDRDDEVVIKIPLIGRRYAARYLGNNNANSLQSIYRIKIYYDEDSTFINDIGKAAITPVAVTLDAVLLIGKVVISPFKWQY